MASSGVRRSRYKRPACPYCGYEDQVVRIVYGLPGPDMIQESRMGEIALGGSSIGPDSHPWYCKGCLRSFDAPAFASEAKSGM